MSRAVETTRQSKNTGIYLLLLLQLCSLWPIWSWYISRVVDRSDEPWGVIALATVLVLVVVSARVRLPSRNQLILCIAAQLAYLGSQLGMPMLVQAVCGVVATGMFVGAVCFGRTFHLSLLALFVLSLPIIASLQFFAGFPVRVLTAHVSSFLLTCFGFPTSAHGTSLKYLGEIVSIDAPCAGIKMLWAGLYLNFSLSAFRSLALGTTWISYSISVLLIFFGNTLRATILFFGEAKICSYPEWAHQVIGLIIFALVASGIFLVHEKLRVNYEPTI